jgi:hypothetical protein
MSEVVESTIISPDMRMLQLNKQGGYNYRYRRHEQWLENYEFYRDTVQINRLTQRQSVNIPLMKQTIRTLLKDVDDMPVLYFENLDNDKQSELFKNEYWKWTANENRMELQDIIDKRQVFLFGRTFSQWQIVDGKIKMTVQDPFDILVDRYCDPFNINSSRFLIHSHIFVPLSDLKNNPDYDQEAVKDMEEWYKTQQGLIKVANNQQLLADKNRKMADMGVLDTESPVLGETIVELSLHFVWRDKGEEWTDDNGETRTLDEEQIMMYVEVDSMRILMKKPLEEVIGVTADHWWRTHYNYDSWADDIERQDFWSDSVADIVRQSNKVVNTWYSQMVENRTMKSFGMTFYDATNEGFTPQTYQPQPFGFYGVPGKPSDMMSPVPVGDVSDSMEDIEFIMGINEKATGAVSELQGAEPEKTITLGQAQMNLSEAKERIKGMSKFYTQAWQDRGMIFVKLLEAAPEKIDAVRIHKKGRITSDIYSREIQPSDWQTKTGYNVKVWSQDDRDTQNMNKLQKLGVAMKNMPGNQKLQEIYDRTLLEFSDLNPEQINEIMQQQEQMRQQQMMEQQMLMNGQAGQAPSSTPQVPPGAGQPPQPQLPAGGGK